MSTKQADNKILLPFIIRGQEINSDELLYQSRDGKVQFHYPDPRPLLNQIILPDPTQLQRDFKDVSVSEIISFLSEAGKAMTLNHARMEQACQFSMPFSALPPSIVKGSYEPVSYTHLRAHETVLDLVCRLLLEKKKKHTQHNNNNI